MSVCIANEHPVARIEHRCCLCGRTIQPGERYNRQRQIGDDGPYVFKDCAHCEAMVRILTDIEGDWYDTWEGYSEYDVAEFEPTTIRTARLKVMWRRRWQRRDGSLYPVPTERESGGVSPGVVWAFCVLAAACVVLAGVR